MTAISGYGMQEVTRNSDITAPTRLIGVFHSHMSAERLPKVSERRTWTATTVYSDGDSGESEPYVLIRQSRTRHWPLVPEV